jgi:hypothetical protein
MSQKDNNNTAKNAEKKVEVFNNSGQENFSKQGQIKTLRKSKEPTSWLGPKNTK